MDAKVHPKGEKNEHETRTRFKSGLKQQQLILNDPPMKINDFGMSRDVQTPLGGVRKQVFTASICLSWKLKVLEERGKHPEGWGVFRRFWWSVGEDTGGGESNTRLCTPSRGRRIITPA